jgi:hypothetical protein
MSKPDAWIQLWGFRSQWTVSNVKVMERTNPDDWIGRYSRVRNELALAEST